MNLLLQLVIIIGTYLLGELTAYLLPSPLPGNVLGFIYLFILLKSGLLKEKRVAFVSDFFLGNLALLFIPGGVGLIKVLHLFDGNVLKIAIIVVVSTILAMLSTAGTIILLERIKR